MATSRVKIIFIENNRGSRDQDTKRQVSKMRFFTMFITAVCFMFLTIIEVLHGGHVAC